MPDIIKVEELEGVIEEREGVAEERIRAKVNLEREMEVIENLGCSTIDKASKGIQTLDVKIDKRSVALTEEFNEFMEDFGEVFE